ncbi:cytochrome P450 [Streptomyces avermitilis]|uniref:cytochrome P450 n=1 Tax=Streptomyces avermitilis TaxID=33903 RepID=UPI0033AD09B7
MISTGFTARRIQLLQTWIEGIVANCLSAMEKDGPPADLVQSFALPIPSMVICELLGVPYADRDGFQRRSVTRFDGTLTMDVRTAAYDASLKYMAELVLRQRADPDESLLGTLVREYGDQIDDRELIGIGDLILLGGHETTANMLGLGTLFLLENSRYAEMVRNGENVEGVVEELLRYLSVVQIGVPRIARKDAILADQHIRRGDRLLCSFPSANHDDAKIPGASVFDPTRRAAHLAFGHGIHYCIGAPLARMEIKIALPALLNRFPGLRLDVAPEAVDFRPSSVFYGLRSLPLTW